MSARDHFSFLWFRNALASTRPSKETLIFFLGIGGTIAIGCAARGFSLIQQTVIWTFLLLAWAVVARQGWLKLFGPVLFYDLTRTARRTRYFLIRTVYTSLLLALLVWLHLMWKIGLSGRGVVVRAADMPNFAESFFYAFMGVQFILVTLLTPAATAGAIAEEKERRTLELLLATDLDNREIVLSKLLSRLLNISFLILAGLPILSFLQFLGGVDPGLVQAGFAATGLTAASLAGLSMFYSTVSKRSRDAIVLTYLTAFGYLVLSGMSALLVGPPLSWGTFQSTVAWTSPSAVKSLAEWFNGGNFILAFVQLSTCMDRGGRLDDVLSSQMSQYAVFHGLVAIGAPLGAIWLLRTAAVKETLGKERKPSLWVRLIGRPRVTDRPMLWKEVFAEPGLRFHWLVRSAVLLVIAASFLPPAIILADYYFGLRRPGRLAEYHGIRQSLNVWTRTVGSGAAFLALLGVAVRAAAAISGERDHKTFDELLVTPLTSKEILIAKWAGSILSVRWAWAWLGFICLVGVATGGLDLVAVPLLTGAWLVYAAAFASIGLWCSMTCRSTLRAVSWTLFAVGTASVGHWLIAALTCRSCALPILLGFTPPFVLGYLAFSAGEAESSYAGVEPHVLHFSSILGLLMWVIGMAILWPTMSERFRVITGREIEMPPRSKTSRHSAKSPAGEASVANEH